jgi:hypothetical protein
VIFIGNGYNIKDKDKIKRQGKDEYKKERIKRER